MSGRRLQHLLFVLLLLALVGLLGWFAERQDRRYDWTANGSHTLGEPSRALLAQLAGPVKATLYAPPGDAVIELFETLLDRYRRAKPDFVGVVINPDLAPAAVRELGVQRHGEVRLEYGGRNEPVTTLSEQAITNTLLRLSRDQRRRVLFLAGHGERDPTGKANHDLGLFGSELARQGIEVGKTNPLLTGGVEAGIALLVIAGPRTHLLPGESELLADYLERGGNLLWLNEPDAADHGLDELAEALGIDWLPGELVDQAVTRFGVSDPSFVAIADYPEHAVTKGLQEITLFPQAAALAVVPTPGWSAIPLLLSASGSWNETAPAGGRVTRDPQLGERPGPLLLAVALTRPRGNEDRQQRVVVLGDGDFLTNTYLGNGGNRSFGLRVVNWLVADDRLISVPSKLAIDQSLELPTEIAMAIGFGYLMALPLLILLTGLGVWWRRRRR